MSRKKKQEEQISLFDEVPTKEPVLKHKNSNQATLQRKKQVTKLDPHRFDLMTDDFTDTAMLIIRHHNREKNFNPKKLSILSYGLKALVFEYSNTISYIVERKRMSDEIEYICTELKFNTHTQSYDSTIIYKGVND